MWYVTVNLTTFEPKWFKQQVCKDNGTKRGGLGTWADISKTTKRMNNALKNCTSWSPGGSWWTKFPCVVHPHAQLLQGQGQLPQLLVTMKVRYYRNGNLVLWVKTKYKLTWARSYSWSPDLEWYPVEFGSNSTMDLSRPLEVMMWSCMMMWLSIVEERAIIGMK